MGIDPTALTALIISIIALVIAVAQFLAQVLGTVEGYRHCQKSVIGQWAIHRERAWSWTQFRCDTLYKTPEIELRSYDSLAGKNVKPVNGDAQSRRETYCNPPDRSDWAFLPNFLRTLLGLRDHSEQLDSELVSWVTLLNTIHDMSEPRSEDMKRHHRVLNLDLKWPVIRLRKRSWDMMPPDIVRPYATTTVTDIAILAGRMGVNWKLFRPIDGIMEGEGHGHAFSATKVRGLGLLVTYTRLLLEADSDSVSSAKMAKLKAKAKGKILTGLFQYEGITSQRYSWTDDANKFWFGLLPTSSLVLPHYAQLKINDMQTLKDTLWMLDGTGQAVHSLQEMQKRQRDYVHGTCDIIPLVAPWLQLRGTLNNHYLRPLRGTKGLLWHIGAMEAFKFQLDQYRRGQPPRQWTDWVATKFEEIFSNSPFLRNDWSRLSIHEEGYEQPTADFYDHVLSLWEETDHYFTDLKGQYPEFRYIDLVTAHLREAPRSWIDAQDWMNKNGRAEIDPTRDHPWRTQAMVFYWKYMPDYRRSMNEYGFHPHEDKEIEEAWIVMIFRGFLWTSAHVGIEELSPVSPEYCGSRMPIFIS